MTQMGIKHADRKIQRKQETDAVRAVLLSDMAHELRTPMNAIIGMSQLLLRTELKDEQREYIENIKSSGDALMLFINNILDISGLEAGGLELDETVYDFRQMLSDINNMLLNLIGSKTIRLIYDIDDTIPFRLYGDGLRIRRVIINLLNNAVRHTKEGHVKLTIRTVENSDKGIGLYVSVKDTGMGIKAEDLQKFSVEFGQTDVNEHIRDGTELGLTVSSRIIAMMGGRLEVRSEYGAGSEFFFTINQKKVTEEQEQAQKKALNFTAPNARILIVDDNEMNRKVATGLLEPFEMKTDTASGGKAALDMIQGNRYDLVFMDYMMPDMDGVETTKRLRAMNGRYYKELPVVALTANAMEDARELFEQAGMNGFIEKPVNMADIGAALYRWLPDNLIKMNCGHDYQDTQDYQECKNLTYNDIEESRQQADDAIYHLKGIDAEKGIMYSGKKEFYVELLGDFYRVIESKAGKIENYLSDNRIKDYTIEVHALKSTARMIGATELSEQCAQLEQLGKEENVEKLTEMTPAVMKLYRSYKDILMPYG